MQRFQHRIAIPIILILTTAALCAAERAATDDLFSGLNLGAPGIVRREMQFKFFDQPCFYMETPDRWGTQWGKFPNTFPYLYQVDAGDGDGTAAAKSDPPMGMRSAVPLGGLGAGTVELRADGSFRDWNIFNNSPADGQYAPKVQLDDALFGLRVRPEGEAAQAWALRTQPPAGIPAIEQIEYAGSFPVSRLRFSDPLLPLKVDLYAYCEFHPGDAKASATPAVIFTFNLRNPSAKAVETEIMFSLPNHIAGELTMERGLRLESPGKGPTSGTLAVRVNGTILTSCGGGELPGLWQQFAADGRFAALPKQSGKPNQAALAAAITLKPGESQNVTFVLAWHLPHHSHAGQEIGNYYNNIYGSADEVAEKVLSRLPTTLDGIRQWQRICYGNGLPVWFQDAQANSLATMYKTGIWAADGRWRQWESFSCPDLDAIHIDLYRSLPYTLFFPELEKSVLEAFVKFQRPDGWIPHTLGWPDFDKPNYGRDNNPIFIIYACQHLRMTGDREFSRRLWPAVRDAARWEMAHVRQSGLPTRIDSTYDLSNFGSLENTSYNAFLFVAAMRAAARLADDNDERGIADEYRTAAARAAKLINERFWTGDFFRAAWDPKVSGLEHALHADAMYGQLWASILDLGPIARPEKMHSHLDWEVRQNGTPFGLQVLTFGSDPQAAAKSGSPIHANDRTSWDGGSMTWSALSLYLGRDVPESLAMVQKVIGKWTDKLHDPWDVRDLYSIQDGYPWCNSHYGRQLIFWAIPFALSGQQYDASLGRLSFDPKSDAPTLLPWYTPVAQGTLERLSQGGWRIRVLAGQLSLRDLRVGQVHREGLLTLATGRDLELR